MNEIAVAQLNTLTSPTVIDVREPDEYESGHVEGAILIPLGSLQDRLAEVPEGAVYVMCRSGKRSAQGTSILTAAGRDATSVTGGILEWIHSGFPVTTGMKA